jgi:hypothetical protein
MALQQIRFDGTEAKQIGSAVGYCTLYGDMAGRLAVISDMCRSDGEAGGVVNAKERFLDIDNRRRRTASTKG